MTPEDPMPRVAPIEDSYWVPDVSILGGEYPGSWHPDLARTKLTALLGAGVDAFLDLTTDHDGLQKYADMLAAEAEGAGLDVVHVPMPILDMNATDVEHMRLVLDTLDRLVAEGRTVYVHCWGGVGRTGLVIGCYLVRHGLSGDEALDQVRSLFATMSAHKVERHRGNSPQTAVQVEMVRAWAELESSNG